MHRHAESSQVFAYSRLDYIPHARLILWVPIHWERLTAFPNNRTLCQVLLRLDQRDLKDGFFFFIADEERSFVVLFIVDEEGSFVMFSNFLVPGAQWT